MADVVVTMADRIAAVSALGMTMPDAWLDTGEIYRGPWGIADTLTQEECVANDVALAIAAARAAERERCAGRVREMAKKFDDAEDSALNMASGDDGGAFLRGKAMGYEFAAMAARDIAERIGKGE